MSVTKTRGHFQSADSTVEIGYAKWVGESAPRGIIQIVHGMCEHIDRYDEFASYFTERGFVVYANNHIGHGDSVVSADDLGHVSGKAGYLNWCKDVDTLVTIAKTEYQNIPFILFGHSMGSMIARLYVALYPSRVDELVICGTSGSNPLVNIGLTLTSIIRSLRGERYRSKFIHNLSFGSYNDRCLEKRTVFDWISINTDNIDRYIADERCGKMFTVSAFYSLMSLIKAITSKDWYQKVEPNLPILLIAGTEDPVGAYGKGVIETQKGLLDNGHTDVSLILYENMRHEIFNEKDKDRVYSDISEFIDGHIQESS
ncbi:MAG: alpha/beta hydrolase [Oscillospiraceae bacterium]|nr:alpha/beta hydrolase [Oscillospiraceae bacterium]